MPVRPPFGPASACLLLAGLTVQVSDARAGSVAATALTFRSVLARSTRVVEGKVLGTVPFQFEGASFSSIEVAVEKTLKGPAGGAGERLRVFDPGKWFQHTHAAAIRGGVISYEDPRYATTVEPRDLKKGAVLLFFLSSEAPPPGFPTGTAFLVCGGAYERAERAKDVVDLKTATFDTPLTLKVGGRVLLPDGLEVELKGHSHKRPIADGPHKEMSELQLTAAKRSELVSLGHVVVLKKDGTRAQETWETLDWDPYRLELVQMKYDDETTLRVRRKPP